MRSQNSAPKRLEREGRQPFKSECFFQHARMKNTRSLSLGSPIFVLLLSLLPVEQKMHISKACLAFEIAVGFKASKKSTQFIFVCGSDVENTCVKKRREKNLLYRMTAFGLGPKHKRQVWASFPILLSFLRLLSFLSISCYTDNG